MDMTPAKHWDIRLHVTEAPRLNERDEAFFVEYLRTAILDYIRLPAGVTIRIVKISKQKPSKKVVP